ncbi:MAG: hypothetical protein QME62_07280 [Armatimonadota bacterium]|nr:hypothetical protein [Armatimonadota bacterium]
MSRIVLLLIITIAILIAGEALPQTTQGIGKEDPLVTIQFRDTPIKSALEALFKGTDRGYVLETGTNGLVTCSIQDTPFDKALNSVLRSAGCTHRIENGIYIIGPKKQESQTYVQQEPWVTESEQPKAKTRVVKIPLQFVDCLDIANILGAETVHPWHRYGENYPRKYGYFGGGFTGIYPGGLAIYGYPGGVLGGLIPFGVGYDSFNEIPSGYKYNPFDSQNAQNEHKSDNIEE